MPSAAVDTAFKSRFATSWSYLATVPVLGVAGLEVTPSDGSPFIVLQYPVVNAEKPSLGRRYFEEGAARIVLNVTRGTEDTDGETWGAALASLFRDRNLGNGVETFTPSGPIVNDTNDDGNYFSLSVIVPYRYQFTDA